MSDLKFEKKPRNSEPAETETRYSEGRLYIYIYIIVFQNEVVRYIALPGQALAYKIGQLKISELREKANSALGENFSLKEFHDVVLNAAGPLDFLEDEVTAWIQSHAKGRE